MKIKWYGHSSFLITTDSGVRIFTDPSDESTGYGLKDLDVDVVTSSHNHFDHNYFAALKGEPTIIKEVGVTQYQDVKITGVHTYHDNNKGIFRGSNVVYVFEADGLRVAHMGDIGHQLSFMQRQLIGKVDVMLIPVGGTFTVDGAGAYEMVKALDPSVVIPMHYSTPDLGFKLSTVFDFMRAAKHFGVAHRLNSSECTLDASTMGSKRIIVMDYAKCE